LRYLKEDPRPLLYRTVPVSTGSTTTTSTTQMY
jgi:hypothetical protein